MLNSILMCTVLENQPKHHPRGGGGYWLWNLLPMLCPQRWKHPWWIAQKRSNHRCIIYRKPTHNGQKLGLFWSILDHHWEENLQKGNHMKCWFAPKSTQHRCNFFKNKSMHILSPWPGGGEAVTSERDGYERLVFLALKLWYSANFQKLRTSRAKIVKFVDL